MAYVTKLPSKRWRAQIERKGVRDSATFNSKAEASGWAARREAEIIASERGAYPRKTLQDAIDRYRKEVSRNKRGARAEGLRFDALARDFPVLVGKVLHEIRTPDWVDWRTARLKVVTPASVRRDVNLFRNLFSVARDEWKWCGESPFKGFSVPSDSAPRERRVSMREVKQLCRWLGYRTGKVTGKQQEVALAFLLALRTGMRAGELLSLSDANVDLTKRVARVQHKTQHLTGRPREIPLTKHAVRLLRPMMGRGQVFTVGSKSLDAMFRKARKALLIRDLHFHDSRAEALTRLARKVDVMTLARISGHKDLKLLLGTYYRESAADIAARL
jgi:integrase